jgi:FKBP-type peptidyl-prolyl cis-trans isomerase
MNFESKCNCKATRNRSHHDAGKIFKINGAVAGFLIGLFVAGFCVRLAAAGLDSRSGFNNQQIIETWGWIIAQEKGVAGIEINKTELAAFMEGFSANLQGRPAPYNLPKIYPDVERLTKTRREKIVRATVERNEASAKAFFSELKQNPNVLDLPDGVRYEIIKAGRGAFSRPEQTVKVNYTGCLIDGREFNQMGPLDVVLVTNRSVCRGWVEALQKLNPGGKMKLYVPPPLSEEEAFRWGIEPGSAVIFEIELLEARETSPEDLKDALLPPAPEPPPPPPSGYSERQIIETWGWSVGQQTGAAKFGLAKADLALLAQGLATGVKGRPAPYDLHMIYPEVKQFVAGHREKVRVEARQKRTAETEALFAGLKQNTNVVELSNGLRYEILKPGSGPFPKTGQTVLVNYVGHLIDGHVFDKTMNEPLHVEVGTVIHGWNEGIQKINKGGKIRLYIPASLGYGEEAVSGIPPGSTLIFEVELVDIQETPQASNAIESGGK